MSRFQGVIVFGLLLLAGCERAPDVEQARMASSESVATPGSDGPRLAYRHRLALEMAVQSVTPRFERSRDRCLNDAALKCVMLNASVDLGGAAGGAPPSAHLSVRLPHAAVAVFEDSILAPLSGEGAGEALLRSRSTIADDLSQAVA